MIAIVVFPNAFTATFVWIHSRLSPRTPVHVILLAIRPVTESGQTELVERSLRPDTIGHTVSSHSAFTLGLSGRPLSVIAVVTFPSATSPPGFSNFTVIYTFSPRTGGSGYKVRAVGRKTEVGSQSLIDAPANAARPNKTSERNIALFDLGCDCFSLPKLIDIPVSHKTQVRCQQSR